MQRRVNRSVLGTSLILLSGLLAPLTGPATGLPYLVPTVILVAGAASLLASFMPNPNRTRDFDQLYSLAIQIARLPKTFQPCTHRS